MIITDGIHLVSTTSAIELHEFAYKIGLRRIWYQDKRATAAHPHYDLTTKRKREKAYEAGAVKVKPAQIIYDAWWTTRTAEQRTKAVALGMIEELPQRQVAS